MTMAHLVFYAYVIMNGTQLEIIGPFTSEQCRLYALERGIVIHENTGLPVRVKCVGKPLI